MSLLLLLRLIVLLCFALLCLPTPYLDIRSDHFANTVLDTYDGLFQLDPLSSIDSRRAGPLQSGCRIIQLLQNDLHAGNCAWQRAGLLLLNRLRHATRSLSQSIHETVRHPAIPYP